MNRDVRRLVKRAGGDPARLRQLLEARALTGATSAPSYAECVEAMQLDEEAHRGE